MDSVEELLKRLEQLNAIGASVSQARVMGIAGTLAALTAQ